MLTAALALVLALLVGAACLAVLMALGAAPLSDDVDYGTDDDPIDADDPSLPYGGWAS